MSPLSTNATGRVKSPTMTSSPPKSSSGPAIQMMNAGTPSGIGCGKLKSFIMPCHWKRNPVTIRSRA